MHKTFLFFVAVALVTLLAPSAAAKLSLGGNGNHNPVIDQNLEEIRLSTDNQLAEIVLDNIGKPVNWNVLCNTEHGNPSLCNEFLHYRSSDGTCNNLQNQSWGAAYMPYRRLAGHDYGDGISMPRKASDSSDLPNARLVSQAVGRLPSSPSSSRSLLHELFGIFVGLDLAATPLVARAETTSCCQKSLDAVTVMINSECASVSISLRDPFLSQFEQTCMPLLRSVPAPTCKSGPRDQMNVATAYLDASMIYGSDQDSTNSRRTLHNGHLHVTDGSVDFSESPYLISPEISAMVRVIFRMLIRYHNNVADRLKEINVGWNDENLFQEARRIVVAQVQHVVYNEYIYKLLGPQAITEYQLTPLTEAHRRQDYDAGMTLATTSEFETATLHFSQSQIPDQIEVVDAFGKVTQIDLSSATLEESLGLAPADVLRGVSRQDVSNMVFTNEITATSFPGDEPLRIDLLALNTQRGREHGLKGYTAVRAACTNQVIKTFADLTNIMDQEVIDRLQNVYTDVRDIDLLVGGASERPVPDGELGPTFTCVLAKQFARIRRADRYWYETNIDDTKFNNEQLRALRSTTLAGIMCNAFPELQMVQRRPFEVVSAKNPLVSCETIPRVVLQAWRN
ncbi:chorion peroxidase-like isoform X1 [Penaeus monodon]|uniref:chorion peroxidase-like isoform X1 n=1 Tax=Penaeus monodon TaxID=6687 RepID=UPI0018A7CD36|nr:chorion peroxidase-like isoform X1 [Penaeus monodon]